MTSPRVQIFLLTHNRPHFVGQAAESILAQRYDSYSLIISDNSSDDRTERVFQELSHPRLHYTRREPCVSSHAHFCMVRAESTAEFFMWFHDDDMLHPDYLSQAILAMDSNPSLAALGANGWRFQHDRTDLQNPLLTACSGLRIFDSLDEFAALYLWRKTVMPFSSYLYRRVYMSGLMTDTAHGGKYSDVSFLLEVLKRGQIGWLLRPLVYCRQHTEQDSRKPALLDRLSLLRYIYRNTRITRHSPAALHYRRVAWCDWLKCGWQRALRRHPRRYFRVLCIMLPYLIRNKMRALRSLVGGSTITNGRC